MKLHTLIGNERVIAMVGSRNVGKTTSLIALLKDLRKTNTKTHIYYFGFVGVARETLKEMKNTTEFTNLEQLTEVTNAIILVDECQKLRLHDRRTKERLDEVIDFIHHANNILILASPNPRVFNSTLGSRIDRWLLKTTRADECVNGSQLKKLIQQYEGIYKALGSVVIPKNTIVAVLPSKTVEVKVRYNAKADTKKDNYNILVG